MKTKMSEALDKLYVEMQKDKERKDYLLKTSDLLDDDGYPTENALEIIRLWDWNDQKGWFDFIKSIWWHPSWGWSEGEEPHEYQKDEIVYRYNISTGGWSGNESIIQAMEQNKNILWSLTWVQSRRGGHYIFEIRNIEDE
jgi:hypothetical protein